MRREKPTIKEKEERKKGSLINKTLEGGTAETIQRFGSAVKEHLSAFSGKVDENGKVLKRGLKTIAQSKVNEEFVDQNIKQQAGFSAEVKQVARENAEKIINREKTRVSRTDDIDKQIDAKGRSVGGTNDQLFDIAEIDADGMYIEGTARQMKFVGGDPKECAKRLLSGKYDKYRDADAVIEIPKDFYNAVLEDFHTREESLKQQIDYAKKNGNIELAKKHEIELSKIEKTRENLKQSDITNEEALEARLHPVLSTGKDIVKVANRAGLYQAGIGGVCAASISIIRNVVACMKGEKEPKDAAIDLVKDTGKGAAVSYATAFSGSVIKGAMQNASSEYVRSLANTNLAAGLVTSTIDIGKTVKKWLNGEIDGIGFVEELGETGVGELGGAFYSTCALYLVGQSGPVVMKIAAGMAGSALGYAAATAVYQELVTSLKEYEQAKEDRIQIELACKEAIQMTLAYRNEMNQMVEQYLSEHLSVIGESFIAMDQAVLEGDVDNFLHSNGELQKLLGRTVQFTTQEQFDELMISDDSFKL